MFDTVYNKPLVKNFKFDKENKMYYLKENESVQDDNCGYDPVNKPSHYADSKYQPIDVIEDWGLDFCLGNTIKYIKRAGHKESGSLDIKTKEIQDLKKARFYLDRRIKQLERRSQSNENE